MTTLQYEGGEDIISFLNNDVLEDEVRKFLSIVSIEGKDKCLCEDIKILVTGTNMQGYFDAVAVEEDFTDKIKFARHAIPTTRHTEVFEFDHKDIKVARSDPEKQKKIAKAARITSSFPAAFPPQFAQSPSFPRETIESYVNTKGEKIKNPLHFWYFDGGVLDNKPLGHAIDHMESSGTYGKWWYFFIEPVLEDTDPDSNKKKPKKWGSDPGNPPNPWETVKTIVDVKMAETIYYDLRRIQKLNHQIMHISTLIEDIWNTLSDKQANFTPELFQDLIDILEYHVVTSRLHDFLPDYLKCVTMIQSVVRVKLHSEGTELKMSEEQHVFMKEVAASLDTKHKEIVDGLSPMNLKIIIRHCRTYIETRKMESALSKDEKDMLIGGIKALEQEKNYTDHFKQYEDDVRKVKDAQILFRQITFWVNDDYRNKKELSKETWEEFKTAWKKLDKAVKSLKESYNSILSDINNLITDDTLFQKMKIFIRLNESFRAAAGIRTADLINVVKIYHNEALGKLAGAKLAHFSGFLERRWRKHDYAMGKKDAREMLAGKMKTDGLTKEFWDEFDEWLNRQELKLDVTFQLNDNDIIKEESDLGLDSLPAGKVIGNINGILKTSRKMINKYSDKSFFRTLKRFKIDLIILILRPLLWLIKQATAQPTCRHDTKDISTLARFRSKGRHYIGMLGLGIIIGLALSFFLPDAFRNGAEWILQKVKSLFGH